MTERAVDRFVPGQTNVPTGEIIDDNKLVPFRKLTLALVESDWDMNGMPLRFFQLTDNRLVEFRFPMPAETEDDMKEYLISLANLKHIVEPESLPKYTETLFDFIGFYAQIIGEDRPRKNEICCG